MPKFELSAKGIALWKQTMQKRMNLIKISCGHWIYKFWIQDNHSINPAWSFYFRSNWNCAINGIDTKVTPSQRLNEPYKYIGDVDITRSLVAFSNSQYGNMISITNSVYYARDLNYGGGSINYQHPTHYLEIGLESLRNEFPNIIKRVANIRVEGELL